MVKRRREEASSSAEKRATPDPDALSPPSSVAVELYSDPSDTDLPSSRPSKYTELDDDDHSPSSSSNNNNNNAHEPPSPSSTSPSAMICALPPHRDGLTFADYDAYEVHYAQEHLNRCLECGRNFPTAHFLALHIAENHDPLNEARKARGEKIYACFVEHCERVCSTPQKRRRHLIDKHIFPKDFDIYIVNDGIDKRRSMLRPAPGHRRRRSSGTFSTTQREQRSRRRSATLEALQQQEPSHVGSDGAPSLQPNHVDVRPDHAETEETRESNDRETASASKVDCDMADLTSSMSALKFVPSSVRFGRGKRGGLLKS